MSAAALKAEGNSYFGSEEWERALECYSQALELVEESDVVSKSALLSNRAACFVKLDQFDKGEY
jgi:tetratricopeptide (TPR) repeat protein